MRIYMKGNWFRMDSFAPTLTQTLLSLPHPEARSGRWTQIGVTLTRNLNRFRLSLESFDVAVLLARRSLGRSGSPLLRAGPTDKFSGVGSLIRLASCATAASVVLKCSRKPAFVP